MDTRQLARTDLNLLVALQALLEERNVSRAAERLFITQSAMSKTLGRLRELLDDPLFTRTAYGIVPTPKAEALQQDLEEVLQGVQAMVSHRVFDPARYSGTFTINVSEYVGVVLLPALMEVLQHEAPGMRVRNVSGVDNQLDELAAGHLDFCVHIQRSHYGDEFETQMLGSIGPLLLVREGHPLTQLEKVTWMHIASYPQVGMYVPDMEELEFVRKGGTFVQYEKKTKDVFNTSHLFTALEVLRRTDYVMPGLPGVIGYPQLSEGIQSLPLPDDVEAIISYMLVTHKRTDHSQAHQWMKKKIMEILYIHQRDVLKVNPYCNLL